MKRACAPLLQSTHNGSKSVVCGLQLDPSQLCNLNLVIKLMVEDFCSFDVLKDLLFILYVRHVYTQFKTIVVFLH
mgnify:CR=1 FL=1